MNKNKISPELLKKIKDSVNITEIVGEHVVLKKSGSNYTGLCPFHSERSPSFSVSEPKQFYYCYGCQKGGDAISFAMEIHGMSFPEAIEDLAERAKVQLPKEWGGPEASTPEAEKRKAAARDKLNLYFKLNRFVAAYFHSTLAQQPATQTYLKKRGVSEEEVRGFYLGAAPPGWDGLAQHLVAKKAPLDIAKELGLIRPSPASAPAGGTGFFDMFRNRAMFPILDMRGKVVAFGGRMLPSDEDSDGPKYMNSTESPIFQKSKIAYGLFQAQKHIREKDEVILVEGYFDVIALHAAGFQNVVATCGTALTPDHLAVFKRFASKVTVLFDGDKAGIAATERAMELGLAHGEVLYGAALPVGLDPDEVLFDQESGVALPEGKAQMQSILSASRPILDVRIEEAIGSAQQGPEARTQALKQVGVWLASYRDPVGREVRIQDVQAKLGVSRQLMEQAMGGRPGAGAGHGAGTGPGREPRGQVRPTGVIQRGSLSPDPSKQAPGGPVKPSPTDRILLQALARGGREIQKIRDSRQNLPPEVPLSDLFDYFPARVFLAQRLVDGEIPDPLSIPTTLAEESEMDPQVRSILTEAWISEKKSDPESDSQLAGALNRGIGRLWARFSQRIKQALQDAEAKKDAGLHAQLSKEYLDVQRRMKEFISFYDEA
jgi:DNA primase